ncbi:endonuclease III [Garciella nitratireducens]|uniref:endonuclease III n=1 Tax=Garciella nitratireducens TaxID=218205 RepID=UPI000DEA3D94|nr:endonuclease III [Garciella nitratireducens]RBP41596.1 DNA-(apurinic or apyrimidinic site) lyase /endonuclease III [Garciella nitratireducens]
MLNKKEIEEVLKILEETYPKAKTALNYTTPFELLIATILSAQCTDQQVNKVTQKLFLYYHTPRDFAFLEIEELEKMIKSCGFYRNKSKNIIETSKILLEKYNGKVPDKREKLEKLPGVGRKTASVVLSNAFGQDAIAVDTHVFRVSNRIGLAQAKDVDKTEKQLMKNIPKEKWSCAHHWLIYHGRNICKARHPLCQNCTIQHLCEFYRKEISKS